MHVRLFPPAPALLARVFGRAGLLPSPGVGSDNGICDFFFIFYFLFDLLLLLIV